MFDKIDGFVKTNRHSPEILKGLKSILGDRINFIELLEAINEIAVVMTSENRLKFFKVIDPQLLSFRTIEELQETINNFFKTNNCNCFEADLRKFEGVLF